MIESIRALSILGEQLGKFDPWSDVDWLFSLFAPFFFAPPATVRSRAIRAKLRDLPPRVQQFEFESKMREKDWRKIRRMNAIQMLGSNFLFYVTSMSRRFSVACKRISKVSPSVSRLCILLAFTRIYRP